MSRGGSEARARAGDRPCAPGPARPEPVPGVRCHGGRSGRPTRGRKPPRPWVSEAVPPAVFLRVRHRHLPHAARGPGSVRRKLAEPWVPVRGPAGCHDERTWCPPVLSDPTRALVSGTPLWAAPSSRRPRAAPTPLAGAGKCGLASISPSDLLFGK